VGGGLCTHKRYRNGAVRLLHASHRLMAPEIQKSPHTCVTDVVAAISGADTSELTRKRNSDVTEFAEAILIWQTGERIAW
jgi:hypothetical protein